MQRSAQFICLPKMSHDEDVQSASQMYLHNTRGDGPDRPKQEVEA
jgi:hypothetical protein